MSVQNNIAGGESVVLERPAAGGVYASLFEKINLNPVSELSALDIWQDAQAMEAGKVEYGTTAMYMRKVKRTMAAGSSTLGQGTAEMPAPLPNLSCGPNTACFRVLDSLTGSEDMEFAYQLQTSTGTVVGRTDSALTHAINSDTEENVNLDYVFQIRAGTR